MKFLGAAALLAFSTSATADPLGMYNGRLFIQAEIAGLSTEALLDSGAEATLVDPAFARLAKLPEGKPLIMKGSGGEAPARLVSGVTVDTLGLTLRPEAIVVTDLTDVSKRLLKRPTSVVVGREIFDWVRLRIDIPGRTIAVADRETTPRGRRLALTAHAGIESIPVRVNGWKANAEFDLGNGSDVMISRAMAKKLRLKSVGEKSGGGIGGEVRRDMVVLRSLAIGGAIFRNVPASIDDQPSANDLNVGTSILKNFVITTDFSQRAVWLEPAGRTN